MRHTHPLRHLVGCLTAVLLILGVPAEQLIPDDCDGHLGAIVCTGSQSDIPASGHLPSTPHVCHDLHGHGNPTLGTEQISIPATRCISQGLTSRPVRTPIPPISEALRPPIL